MTDQDLKAGMRDSQEQALFLLLMQYTQEVPGEMTGETPEPRGSITCQDQGSNLFQILY